MLTHIDENNLPTMVDVTSKTITPRTAVAQSQVQLPARMKEFFKDDEIYLKKGPVFQTAMIAGTMAAKKTHELIPFCHQIPIESCKFKMSVDEKLCVTITCRVKTTFKTGVEMEALHGAMTAALTIYDMCKAVSHDIVIKETKLLSKTGGKSTLLSRPLYGLILTGGKSERMKRDKALISYQGKPHAEYIYDILKNYCAEVYLSCRPGQWAGTPIENLPKIDDVYEDQGPMGGILSAFNKHSEANWFVVACDLVYFNRETVERILADCDENAVATCYKNNEKGFPEPLCSLYTPQAKFVFAEALAADNRCPVRVLKDSHCQLIEQQGSVNLANINTVEELQEIQK